MTFDFTVKRGDKTHAVKVSVDDEATAAATEAAAEDELQWKCQSQWGPGKLVSDKGKEYRWEPE